MDRDAGVLEGGDHARHELVGDVRVDQQRLGSVADTGAVGLGVQHDRERLVEVGRSVDVHVAVADAGLDDRHRRLLDDRADQAGSPSRDQHVDVTTGPHQRLDAVVGVARDQLDDVRLQAGGRDGVTQHGDDRGVAGPRAGAAAQEYGVAGLQADAGGVGRDVGPCLVDHPDDAERHPDLAQLQSVREGAPPHHLADRVGQPGDVAQPLGHVVEALGGESQPVDDVGRGAAGLRALDVLGVGGEDLVRAGEQRRSHVQQRGVLLGTGRQGQAVAGRAGSLGHLEHLGGHGPRILPVRVSRWRRADGWA